MTFLGAASICVAAYIVTKAYIADLLAGDMAKFPETRDALKEAGYTFSDHAQCRGCKEEIEWWITPAGRKMPMNLMQDGNSEAKSHFSTCTRADEFRKG